LLPLIRLENLWSSQFFILFYAQLFFNIPITFSSFIECSLIGISMTFLFSIFNWKIYLSLRKAQNCEKLKIKDDHEKLEKEIIQIVNQAVAKNPKLARKKKLLQLEKKWFWQK
jgi:hypothetical protein